MTNPTSGHQGTVKSNMARVIKTREFLEDLRVAIMKNHALGKNTHGRPIMDKHGMNSMSVTWLLEIGAIEDKTPVGTAKADGRLLKWTYGEEGNGIVNQPLIDALINQQAKYFRDNKAKREIIDSKPITSNMKKLPTGTSATMDAIVSWIEEELTKEDVVPGYLRGAQKAMYNTIRDVLSGIKPNLEKLKSVLEEINI